jgi:hypothetical protein
VIDFVGNPQVVSAFTVGRNGTAVEIGTAIVWRNFGRKTILGTLPRALTLTCMLLTSILLHSHVFDRERRCVVPGLLRFAAIVLRMPCDVEHSGCQTRQLWSSALKTLTSKRKNIALLSSIRSYAAVLYFVAAFLR